MAKKRKSFVSWRKYHRWAGIVLALFMIVFCVSGIILNHRNIVSCVDVNRSMLPSGYRVADYNNGVVKGSLRLGNDTVVVYGCGGVWLADTAATHWKPINNGFGTGVDRRNVRNVVADKSGTLWCVTNYSLFRYDGNAWEKVQIPSGSERLADVSLNEDSTRLAVLSRSAVYLLPVSKKIIGRVERRELKAPAGFSPKETLFRTVWKLHSGELFGLPGILVVDAIAVVLIILSVTGIVIFILPYGIRRSNRKGNRDDAKRKARSMGLNLRWHNKLGSVTIILTLLLTFTGTCLRPPFMIPLVMVKTAPFNASNNPWNDKLRTIRWDKQQSMWLLSTSEGFITVDHSLCGIPTMAKSGTTPPVSPMGVNVMVQQNDGSWLVGSFSGMYSWQPKTRKVLQYPSGKPVGKGRGMMATGSLASGFSEDFLGGKPIVFGYSDGSNNQMPPMPEEMKNVPLSLWNVALELHVGRCYAPFLGPFSEMFVFLFGTLITLIVLSGYIVYRRTHRKHRKGNANRRDGNSVTVATSNEPVDEKL